MAANDKPHQLGRYGRKCDTKLRVIANGDLEVSVRRSERCGALTVAASALKEDPEPSMDMVLRGERGEPVKKYVPPRGTLGKVQSEAFANVFISKHQAKALPGKLGVSESARIGTLSTARIPLSKLKTLAADPLVRQVSLGQTLKDPDPVIAPGRPAAPGPGERAVGSAHLHHNGRGVLVGIIDVQGFDFAHADFLAGRDRTRFAQIWDQGARPDGTSPQDYGRVIDRRQMNAALKAARGVGAPATQLEPQSQMDFRSHGTHVASIAAGNLGIAREATLAGVLVSLGPADWDRRKSFYDSTRIAHAVDWLLSLPAKLGKPDMPVSINISLGTNGHAHDSSAPVNRWIDLALASPGRCVCVAAGNAGQEKAVSADDIGFVMGRIHTSGTIPAAGLDHDIEWVVAGGGGRDYSENELEIWFSAQDKVAVSVREPNGTWHGPIAPLEYIENRRLADKSFLSVYNDLYHAANGDNYISVYLSPNFKAEPIIGVAAGQWIVRLHGRDIRDGRFDGWIERDDPSALPPDPEQPRRWRFPSFFTERSNVDRCSISTLACGNRVVAVANLDKARECINITSSQGPARDGRNKPDIAAPGTDIVAASGFGSGEDPWVAMTGTSMASPFVCGTVALMLAARKDLTAAQIVGILRRSARPLAGASFAWQNDAGFGVLDPEACVLEADRINKPRKDRTS
jgi:subtilisin family serine protease